MKRNTARVGMDLHVNRCTISRRHFSINLSFGNFLSASIFPIVVVEINN